MAATRRRNRRSGSCGICSRRSDGRTVGRPCPQSSDDTTRWIGTNGGSARNSRSIDRKSTRLNSSHANISYAVFCLKKKKRRNNNTQNNIKDIQNKDSHDNQKLREQFSEK